MADLLLKYFQEDLTEAEDQELEERLFSSDEDAMRFREEAAKAYQQFGLPEPVWPGDPNDWPRPKSGGGSWILPFLVLVGLAGLFFWGWKAHATTPVFSRLIQTFFSVSPSGEPSPQAGLPPSSAKPRLFPASTNRKESQATIPSKIPISPKPAEKSPHLENETQALQGQNPLSSSEKPFLAPIRENGESHPTHSNLAVQVRRTRPGQVAVRVLNLEGSQVALLYQGPLAVGTWTFDWDGKLANGTPLAPGHYEIQLESGPVTQRKMIVIRQ